MKFSWLLFTVGMVLLVLVDGAWWVFAGHFLVNPWLGIVYVIALTLLEGIESYVRNLNHKLESLDETTRKLEKRITDIETENCYR